ncbi:MAG: adenylate/guanylate cyclase domain-containing protein [Chloroflexota bacterium]
MARNRVGRPSLRTTLLTLLVGLLLVTVLSLATVAQMGVTRIVDEMESRSFTVGALAIGTQVDAFFSPTLPLLQESVEQVQRGRLRVDDTEELSEYLVGRLRRSRSVGWLSFSHQATGQFVGAWRRPDGAIVLNRSRPDVDGGKPFEVEVTPDGRRVPFYRDLPGGYDPRTRPWYQQATASDGPIWTEPFLFNEGAYGVTAAVALREPVTNRLLGVFTADFFLDDISRFLAETARATSIGSVRLMVLSRAGVVVADSVGQPDGDANLLASQGGLVLPGGFGALSGDRPVAVSFPANGVQYVGAFKIVGSAGGPEWIAAILMREDEVLQVVNATRRQVIVLGVLLLSVAVVLGSVVAHKVSVPLNVVARDLEQIGRFELSPEASPSSFVQEIAVVGTSVDRMKAGLRSFARYVPTEVVGDLLAHGEDARLGVQYRRMTIHFSDVEGFSRIAEQLPPDELIAQLSEYLRAMTAILREEHGSIDKFLGDGILAFFNAPHDVPDHVRRACRAAVRSIEQLAELNRAWEAEGRSAFHIRIGLHVGETLVGNVGTPERFDYTVVGDAVNLASRLESLNKLYGTVILATDEVRREAGDGFEWRTLDRVAVVGRASVTLVCELLGEAGRVPSHVLDARDVYERALKAYVAGDFRTAADGFHRASVLWPDDHAAVEMAARAEDLAQEPTPADWSGVYAQLSKL